MHVKSPPLSDAMDLHDRTVVILGGSGLVGHAVARRLLTRMPRRVVLVALSESEAREAALALDPERGASELAVEWGNVFWPAPVARLPRDIVLADPARRALVLDDLFGDLTDEVLGRSLLCQLLERYHPEAVVDSINTATALAYQDVFRSAQELRGAAVRGEVEVGAIERHLLTLPMPQLIRHQQILLEALRRAGTRTYVKVGTSGTGGMGFNIPYTHSEERPSPTLLTKSALAGAHSLLLFLMGRTPDAPATIEVKPTATIAWREIRFGPVRRDGRPIPLVDCTDPVPVAEAFRAQATPWRDLQRSLEGVYINVGENGLFSRDEFETVTSLGSMEFITPEEVADYVLMELEGRPTGRDTVAALDAATAGPTYRAGVLRSHAIGRLEALERAHGTRSVAYEMLGPPRLTKLLYEAHVCSVVCSSVRALADSDPVTLARDAYALIQRDTRLRRQILSVGIPILAPDGQHLHRGSRLAVHPERDDLLAAASRGWVDLRPEEFARWINRAREIVQQAERRPSLEAESGSDVAWAGIAADDPIRPAQFVAWVFGHEERGERVKR